MLTELILIVLVGTSTLPKHVIELYSLFSNVSVEKLDTPLLTFDEFWKAFYKHLFGRDKDGCLYRKNVGHVFVHYDVTCVLGNEVLKEISDALSKEGVVYTFSPCLGDYQFDDNPGFIDHYDEDDIPPRDEGDIPF